MRVIEPGHIYELDHIDGEQKQTLTFVNRETNPHEGTQTQEVLRATIDIMSVLIDRTNHCDACLRWVGNDRIIKALSETQRQMRFALLLHEQRALERKLEKGDLQPEMIPVEKDGHWRPLRRYAINSRQRNCEHIWNPTLSECPKCGLTKIDFQLEISVPPEERV